MTRNDIATADELWEAARRHFPTPSPDDQKAGIKLLQELARGEPVTLARLAEALGRSVDEMEAFTSASPLSPFVHTDEGGRIQAFLGLSVTPTHHQITIGGRRLWAWCAPDTLAYAELLGETTEIETRDPERDQLVRLAMSPGRIETVNPT